MVFNCYATLKLPLDIWTIIDVINTMTYIVCIKIMNEITP